MTIENPKLNFVLVLAVCNSTFPFLRKISIALHNAQVSPDSVFIEKGEREKMKGSDLGLSLPTEKGNEAGYGVVIR